MEDEIQHKIGSTRCHRAQLNPHILKGLPSTFPPTFSSKIHTNSRICSSSEIAKAPQKSQPKIKSHSHKTP